jgi:hypothetical protein
MLSEEKLRTAERRIATSFVKQCRDGKQNLGMQDQYRACGQFLGTDSLQRGLHGTTAAIRVMATETLGEDDLVRRLIAYAENRDAAERDAARTAVDFEGQLQLDSVNVIKQSELLYALTFVGSGVASTEAMQQKIADSLLEGMASGEGWGYFTGKSQPVEPLPTAFALRALDRVGKQAPSAVLALADQLEAALRQRKPAGARADISVYVFCLYVLTFGRNDEPLEKRDEKMLRKLFDQLWHHLEPLLAFDIEQNVEYMHNGSHQYVRVPWQLYLLALAARLAPLRAFASLSAQGLLRRIVDGVASPGGFVYPHSGALSSSRTNAVAYEVIQTIIPVQRKNRLVLIPAIVLDHVRQAFGSRSVSWALRFAAGTLIIVAVWDWRTRGAVWDGIAQNLMSSLLAFLLTVRIPQ